ncbi:RNA polymerase subunit sigma-70 [Salipaludibacillus keqinensis]|uniref:RNA polymerase subunit sigma-70 n=1 Tax=Salipaludibacillus keqinensis TaxID=2045207 RepID=A0A323TAF0_9BACI|nr:sugar-binding transcriptional regulator [Salipaludibacillus keqinensis]PYZ92269.1 RNA polymerase subunit sigma-70 [Salipaludibacillus keqinensis]
MEKEKRDKVIEAARMYYIFDYNQSVIAEKLGVSRPTVSRLLDTAKQEGIVEIKVVSPEEDIVAMTDKLQKKFGLKKVLIAHTPEDDETKTKQYLGRLAAQYLNEIVQDGDIIGVTWGTTIHEVAKELKPKSVSNVKVVQLKGGVSHSETNTYAGDILYLFGQAYHTVPHHLPLPAIVDHVVVKQAMEADRYIRNILELGRKANIALSTIGPIKSESLLFQLGYFSDEDLELIHEKAVGDISSRFFNEKGEICHSDLNLRTLGIELEDLRSKDYSILVAGGENKRSGIKGALNGQYVNVLVTDIHTANHLLEEESL